MDISSLFRTCIKTLTACNDVIGGPPHKGPNLNIPSKKSSYVVKAQRTINQIEKLYELLLENQRVHFNALNSLTNKTHLTNFDHSQIDSLAQNTISSCSQSINELRNDVAQINNSPQYQEHLKLMTLLIEDYLKYVSKIYSEQKTAQLKRSFKLNNLNKLESATMKKSSLKIQEINDDVSATNPHTEDEQLSSEDIQIYEAENEQLYNELNSLTNKVMQVERKVVQITELQETFTENILNQDKNVDGVFTTIVGSTENVREANEQIRSAIRRNAGLRVWVLFFILVMSFTLIFLDWYNP